MLNSSGAYCMYLRKSRADMDAEAHGEGETLARHEARLRDFAARHGISISQVYREIESGDTITSRPVMQQLLTDVEHGLWEGVLVVEVERLARGDTIDQGLVARTFKYSGAKIITPMKVFDPLNEYDEEYFEFGLFMSRREYKAINRRLQAGKLASIKEGKWVFGSPPFGYDLVKIPHEKGSILVPNKDADTIRTLFRLYADNESMGTVRLSAEMNRLGLKSATGKDFHVGITKELLQNPVYAGYITHKRRATVKHIQDGQVVIGYPRHKDYDLYKGRHEALIDEETWTAVTQKLAARSFVPVRKDKSLKNPLSGLIICQCGRKMQMRSPSNGRFIFCNMYCGAVSSKLEEVENALLRALHQWLVQYQVKLESESNNAPDKTREIIETNLQKCDKDLSALTAQQERAFELVETNVYTPEQFKERQHMLDARRKAIMESIAEMKDNLLLITLQEQARKELIPRVRLVIESYRDAESAQEKNDLLKTILSRVDYTKTATQQSATGSDLHLTIHPLVPVAIK